MVNALDRVWRTPAPSGADLPPALRLLSGQLADALAMQAAGLATRDDIDLAMRLGAGYPQGPFAVLDGLGSAAAVFWPGSPPRTRHRGRCDDQLALDRRRRRGGHWAHGVGNRGDGGPQRPPCHGRRALIGGAGPAARDRRQQSQPLLGQGPDHRGRRRGDARPNRSRHERGRARGGRRRGGGRGRGPGGEAGLVRRTRRPAPGRSAVGDEHLVAPGRRDRRPRR